MCTDIVERTNVSGGGRGAQGWFTLAEVSVSYDHPFHVQLEHALNIAPQYVEPGDAVIVSGDLGRHGMAIMAVREG